MKTTTLSIVHSIAGSSENDEILSARIWEQTVELLHPLLGQVCSRFEPAVRAWQQSVERPYGVVFGRSDPALFLYFYSMGKDHQERAVQHHMTGLINNFDMGELQEELPTAIHPKPGAGPEISAHLLWHLGLIGGEILPDAGVYYASARQSFISDKLNEQIFSSIEDYAVSVVHFCMITNPDEGN